jgi:trk system potassium uptake protein TrkH
MLFFVLSSLMLIPISVDLCCGHQAVAAGFTLSSLFSGFVGGLLYLSTKTDVDVTLNIKEKILLVLIAWMLLPIAAAMPFITSPFQIPWVDCFYEAVSALTTTGNSSVYNIKNYSAGFILWHSILQIFGGVCFIISCLYVFAKFRSTYAIKIESTTFIKGDSFAERLKKIITIYVGLVFIGVLLIAGAGFPVVDAVYYATSALSSSGFFVDASSGSIYSLHLANWTLVLLMFIGGCSIGLIINVVQNGLAALNNQQFICYGFILSMGTVILSIYIHCTSPFDGSLLESLEKAFVLTVSSITNTGMNFIGTDAFGNFMDTILYIMNFCGGCSGSCTGGIKIFRIIMIFLLIKSYLMRLTKTNAIYIPIYAGKRLGDAEITSLFTYFLCYAMLAIVFALLMCYGEMDFGKAIGMVVTTMNNNGPFLGTRMATYAEIAAFSPYIKSILMLAMIAGRVEFLPFFLVAMRSFWSR